VLMIDLNKIRKKLSLYKNMIWKMNVSLPIDPFKETSDYDKTRSLVSEALERFWKNSQWHKKTGAPYYEFITSETVFPFDILSLSVSGTDWRDAVGNSKTNSEWDAATIGVTAEIDSTVKTRQIMLVIHPLELYINGKIIRNKHTKQITSVEFESLNVSDGKLYIQPLITKL